jgi:hypothetical protein
MSLIRLGNTFESITIYFGRFTFNPFRFTFKPMANILNPELVAARKNSVIEALKLGHSYTAALKIAGLNPRSAAQWRETDLSFEEAIQKHLQERPQAVHNQQRMPTRTAKDVPTDEMPDVVEEVCKAVRAGLPIDFACLLTNISRGTVRKWMVDDPDIAARINKAQAQNMLWWVSKIRSGAERDWKAALAYLERIFPHLFGEIKAVEITTRAEDKQEVIDVTPEATIKRLTEMSDEDLQAIIGKGTI